MARIYKVIEGAGGVEEGPQLTRVIIKSCRDVLHGVAISGVANDHGRFSDRSITD